MAWVREVEAEGALRGKASSGWPEAQGWTCPPPGPSGFTNSHCPKHLLSTDCVLCAVPGPGNPVVSETSLTLPLES